MYVKLERSPFLSERRKHLLSVIEERKELEERSKKREERVREAISITTEGKREKESCTTSSEAVSCTKRPQKKHIAHPR